MAVICALPVEADAVDALFDISWDENGYEYGKAEGDPNSYTTGLLGKHNVVLTHLPGTGKTSASGAAASLRSSFPCIRLALVVGVCGGVPKSQAGEEMILGDIVISESAVEYDLGEQYADIFIRKSLLGESLGRPSLELRSFLAKLKTRRVRNRVQQRIVRHLGVLDQQPGNDRAFYPGVDADRLFESPCRHKHYDPGTCLVCRHCKNTDDPVCEESRKATCQQLGCKGTLVVRRRLVEASRKNAIPQPVVHFGSIASGNHVMKSSEHRDEISLREGTIAFEMESAGAWDHFPCLVVKGVCNYADGHENKVWQHYAASASASCAKALLYEWSSPEAPAQEVEVKARQVQTYNGQAITTQKETYRYITEGDQGDQMNLINSIAIRNV